ncbi:MAG: hypothetical protein KIT09_23590 [Bryobacteraceae bacterium]|nr:hypothetical protein [Bryobacteraceae bacterium]
MILEADNRVRDWAGSVLGEAIVTLGPPPKQPEGRGVYLYLSEIRVEPTQRNAWQSRLQARLRYIITAWDEKPEEAHRLLGTLLEAAIDHPDFLLDSDLPGPEFWRALGAPPQPCLCLLYRATKETPRQPLKFVRKVVLDMTPAGSLHGVVIGPEDLALAEALVELPSLGLSTKTDHRGRFRFNAVPAGPPPRALRIRAKGREVNVDLSRYPNEDSPYTVHIEMEE